MAELNINKAEFIKSAAAPAALSAMRFPISFFSGKSNVGKSSVINRLLNRKKLCASRTVARKTVHVNYFLIDKRFTSSIFRIRLRQGLKGGA